MPEPIQTPRRALWLLALLTLVWGSSWPIFQVAVQEVSVWTFRALAMPLAGAVLLAVAWWRGQPLAVPRSAWPALALSAVLYLSVWNIASTYAAVLLPSGQAAVLGFTMPVWAALISVVVLGERLGPRLLWSLGFGAGAVLLLMVPSFGAYAQAPLGLALGLTAGFFWAVGTLVLKRAKLNLPATVQTGWQLLIAAVPVVLGAAVLGQGPLFVPSASSLAAMLYISLVAMCLGNLCWFSIVGLLPANVAGLGSVLVPVVAMLSGAWVHGEPLGPMQLTAMVCSVASLSLALFKPAPPVNRAHPYPADRTAETDATTAHKKP